MNHVHGPSRGAAVVRIAVAVWLVVATAILLADGVTWGLILLVPAALHVSLAVRGLRRPQPPVSSDLRLA